MRKTVFVFCLIFIVQLSFAQGNAKPLTNEDVFTMLQMGLSEDVIVEKIRTAETTKFDTSLDALKALKEGKVSDLVIKQMINPKAGVVQQAALKETSPWPDEVGVYALSKGKMVEVVPEIVNWRTGGVLKSMATMGLTKGHINGTVRNGKSSLGLTTPLEFIIRAPEGTSASEYQLLRLDVHGDRREFRALTGGVIHASGGADRNAVDFQFEKVAPRVFRIKVAELGKGEYGFLPPGVSSASVASQGKIHSFTVIE